MKKNSSKMKGWLTGSKFSIFILGAIITFLATGCLDDEPAPEPQPVAYVSMYHLAPISSTLAINIDNRQINNNPFAFTDYTGYIRFLTGERSIKFTPFTASNTLLENDVNLVQDSLYSIFIAGTSDSLEFIQVNDKVTFEDDQNSLIRILHASPDAPNVNLVFVDNVEVAFDEIGYRGISDFDEISSGTASFEIRNAETDELISNVSNYSFAAGNFYTIVVRGLLDTENEDFELSVQVIRGFLSN